jgi:hypothetical protein
MQLCYVFIFLIYQINITHANPWVLENNKEQMSYKILMSDSENLDNAVKFYSNLYDISAINIIQQQKNIDNTLKNHSLSSDEKLKLLNNYYYYYQKALNDLSTNNFSLNERIHVLSYKKSLKNLCELNVDYYNVFNKNIIQFDSKHDYYKISIKRKIFENKHLVIAAEPYFFNKNTFNNLSVGVYNHIAFVYYNSKPFDKMVLQYSNNLFATSLLEQSSSTTFIKNIRTNEIGIGYYDLNSQNATFESFNNSSYFSYFVYLKKIINTKEIFVQINYIYNDQSLDNKKHVKYNSVGVNFSITM